MKAISATSIGASLQAFAAQAPAAPRPHPLPPRPAAASRDHQEAPGMHLTPRQLEVLALLCEGLPNKLICRQLNIATGTVKVHMGCILRELGAASRLQAVVAARRLGLVGDTVASAPEYSTGPVLAPQPMMPAVRPALGPGYRDAVAF